MVFNLKVSFEKFRNYFLILISFSCLIFLISEHLIAQDQQEDVCIKCHKLIRKVEWDNSVHKKAGLGCLDCHSDLTDVDPEKGHSKNLQAPDCAACHDEEIIIEYKASIHGTGKPGTPNCVTCHNPHEELPRADWSREYVVGHCLKCHHPGKGHLEWLIEYELHMKMLHCNICHAAVGGSMSHKIVHKDKAIKDCIMCHSKETVLKSKIQADQPKDDGKNKISKLFAHDNEQILNKMGYVIGVTKIKFLDLLGAFLIAGSLAVPVFHGGFRIFIYLRRGQHGKRKH